MTQTLFRRRGARLAALIVCTSLLPSAASAQRAKGIDVSHFQGTMNWDTAYSQDVRFAFVRASRGGTGSGTWGSQSLDDTQFSANVLSLRNLAVNQNKVIYNGFYHYARPDMIAVNDGNNGGGSGFNFTNSQPSLATIIANAQDEAQHFYNVVGSHYAPGGPDIGRRLRPVLDVEERGGPTGQDTGADALTRANLSLWVDTFLNRFQQLTGGVRPLLYMNNDYCTFNVDTSLADEDFWIARWNQTSFGNPLTTGSPPTGVFGGAWDFWQYDSQNGLGTAYGAEPPPLASPDMDLNVANGDINFVRTFLVPEPAGAAITMGLALSWLTGSRRRRRV